MKFKKKPVIIDAIQWNGENATEIANFTKGNGRYIEVDESEKVVRIATLEGVMTARINDYIIKGVQGEFYPCKPDIFEQTYEKIQKEKSSTNFEKIKNMTLDEFVEWLTDVDDASEVLACKMCLYCAKTKHENGDFRFIQCCDEDQECRKGIREWLLMKNDNYI